FNSTIAALATTHNAAVFDANALLARVKAEGYSVAGETFTGDYVSGGVFSLDGVHPSSRGYAIVANEMIRVMNDRFGMSVPMVDISGIPGIPAPLAKGAVQPGIPKIPEGAFRDFDRLFRTGW
ncbi:MAG: hypothetical protein WD295_00435, partial [Bacteroidota bacterium]